MTAMATLNGVEAKGPGRLAVQLPGATMTVYVQAVRLVVNGHVGDELVGARVFPVRSSDGSRRAVPPARAKHVVAAGLQLAANDQEARERTHRDWDDDYCHGCGKYLDPALGRSRCADCTGAPA